MAIQPLHTLMQEANLPLIMMILMGLALAQFKVLEKRTHYQ